MAITRAQQFRQMLKNAGAVEQDGVMNYIKNSESVTVPKKFKARKNAPATKLAYITDAEAKMLKKKKPGTPHKGPKGIPSYDSFDAKGNYTSGEAMSAAERGDIRGAQREGMSESDARDIRASAIRAGAGTGRDESPERQQPIVSQATDLFNLKNQQLGSAANKTAAQQKAFRDFYKGMGLGDDAILADLEGEDDDAKPAFDFTSLSGDDPVNILEDDKRQELVERYINEPVEGTDTGIFSIDTATGILADMLGKNQAKLRQRTVDLSDRLSKERTINYPKFMTKDGKPMKFDANLRTKSNLLSNLLDTEKTKLGLKGDSQTGRVDFYDLPTSSQKEIGKKLNDARMQGLTDASGNFKAGVRIEKIPFRKADGTIEMRDQIIDNRDDRGGGSDPVTITSNPELLKLQKQNKDLQNQLAQQDQNIFYRLAADGGMIEDAPVGGIMDLESGRQMYFLGKLVKKATRAVKKIVKSPLGKAALIGGLGYLGFKGMGGASGLSKFLFKEGGKGLPFGELLKGGLTGGGMLALGGALTAAPLLFGKQEDDDDTIDPSMLGPRLDIASLLANPYQATLGTGFRRTAADGGRIGYKDGTIESGAVMSEKEMKKLAKSPLYKGFKMMYGADPSSAKDNKAYEGKFEQFEKLFKKGYQKGGDVEPVAKKTMPLLDMDGQEMDLRDNGGFVPIGRMEKADDVPARLSKNEFVFTADAVRNAGDGSVDKGAEVMYNMMKNLEAGGEVSEESQGLEGARKMFQTSQRLEEVL